MSALKRLSIPSDCLHCDLPTSRDFCNLPEQLIKKLMAIGHVTVYPSNANLLEENELPRGIYIVCSGKTKLSLQARDQRTIIVKIGGSRQVMGLSAVICGVPSPVTVTTIEPCQIKLVEAGRLRRLIESDSEVGLNCARALAQECVTSFDDVHDLLRARSSTEKLARLMLTWVAGECRNRELRIPKEFTHEEIAQMIGSSRETVTRLISDMKKKDLIRFEGATLVIPNRIALQAIAS